MMIKHEFLLLAALSLTFSASAGWCQTNLTNTLLPPVYDASGHPIEANSAMIASCAGEHSMTPVLNTDQVSLQQIAQTVSPMSFTAALGDADGDGLLEIYMLIETGVGNVSTRIFENNGYNAYYQVYQTSNMLYPQVCGDTDQDGLPEVLGQLSYNVYVWESPAPGQFATQSVWQSPNIPNILGPTSIGDLDQDGHLEIIHSQASFGSDNRLVIWENSGNNQYTEIINLLLGSGILSTHALADFDGDGLQEIAFANMSGNVFVYESTGNNSLQRTFHDNMHSSSVFYCSKANDLDGNGRPEFIVSGCDVQHGWITRLYEATGNDSFAVRFETTFWDNYFGMPGNTAGDLDADGLDEFAWESAQILHVLGWNGQSFVEEQTIPELSGQPMNAIYTYDTNNNGYDDLVWLGISYIGFWASNTRILEQLYDSPVPNLYATLAPQSQPYISLPPSGGTFSYQANLTNRGSSAVALQAWNMVILPNGQPYGPVLGPVDITISPTSILTRTRSQYVPASAPAGTYNYVLFLGANQDSAWTSASFIFTKTGVGDFGLDAGEWTNTGEEFDGGTRSVASLGGSELDMTEHVPPGISPNPFNAVTVISYELRAASFVKLAIYDVSGRLATTLVDGWREGGNYKVTWNASDLSSGLYFCRIQAGNFSAVKKLMLLK